MIFRAFISSNILYPSTAELSGMMVSTMNLRCTFSLWTIHDFGLEHNSLQRVLSFLKELERLGKYA